MNNIYLITPNKLNKRFYYYLPKVLSTKKIKFLQVRSKKLSKVKLLNHIKKIIPIVKKYKTKLIINDYPEFASTFNCGFHLGQKDLKNKLNKQYLDKKKFFGITCHNSIALGRKAMRYKPDYLAFGAFFKTKTKSVKFDANPSLIKKAKKIFKIPIVGIGGINSNNYKILLKNGVNYIAVSGFIWRNKNMSPIEAIKKFK